MKKTNITVLCRHCSQEFRLFADDGFNDTHLIWNWCPHCHKRNDFWIRFIDDDDKTVPMGIGAVEAQREVR